MLFLFCSIGLREYAFPLLLVANECPLAFRPVRKQPFPLPVKLPLFPLSVVFVAIWPCILTLSVALVVDVPALVHMLVIVDPAGPPVRLVLDLPSLVELL